MKIDLKSAAVIWLSLSTLSQCYKPRNATCNVNPDVFAHVRVQQQEQKAAIQEFMDAWFDTDTFTGANLTSLQAEWLESMAIRHPDDNSSLPESDNSTDPLSRKKRASSSCYEIPNALSRDPPTGVRRRIRKEIREMSSFEWKNFIKSIKKLKFECVPDPNDPQTSCYDVFVKMHQFLDAPAAHEGAAFLPWHREFLYCFENALIEQGYLYGLPYWDSTLDETLPFPYQSELWTEKLLGVATGEVGKPFSNWSTLPGPCSYYFGDTLRRNIVTRSREVEWLFSKAGISGYLSLSCYRDLADITTYDSFEYVHGSVHVFMGGHMRSIQCSPNDPLFWMHHTFVDCVWEEFRQKSQTSDVEREYPSRANGDYIGGALHEWDAYMSPFRGLQNAHGLLNWYTDYFYKCSPRPGRCSSDLECGNRRHLWCDESCQCRPKLRTGGDCTGLPDRACADCTTGVSRFAKCISNVCACVRFPVIRAPDGV